MSLNAELSPLVSLRELLAGSASTRASTLNSVIATSRAPAARETLAAVPAGAASVNGDTAADDSSFALAHEADSFVTAIPRVPFGLSADALARAAAAGDGVLSSLLTISEGAASTAPRLPAVASLRTPPPASESAAAAHSRGRPSVTTPARAAAAAPTAALPSPASSPVSPTRRTAASTPSSAALRAQSLAAAALAAATAAGALSAAADAAASTDGDTAQYDADAAAISSAHELANLALALCRKALL